MGQAQVKRDIDVPILIVSDAMISEAQQTLLTETSLAVLKSKAELQEFDLVLADKAVWLIPSSFAGAQIKAEFAQVCDTLREKINANGLVLNKELLNPVQRQQFNRQLALVGNSLRSSISEIIMRDDMIFGFDVQQGIVLSNGDRRITLRETEGLDASLINHDWNKTAAGSGYDERTNSIISQHLRGIRMPSANFLSELHFEVSQRPALKPRTRALRMKELMEYVTDRIIEADAVAKDAEDSLIDLLMTKGGTGYKDAIVKGTSFGDINPKLKSLFESSLLADPTAYGFEGDADVIAFLSAAIVERYGRDLKIIIPRELPDGNKVSLSYPFGSDIGH